VGLVFIGCVWVGSVLGLLMLNDAGVGRVIIGRALYEGTIDVAEAVSTAR
jgi:phosphoribosylformimino-5-aminoimidazole carboxamide ribonucleotide (ProFAR) isomerase